MERSNYNGKTYKIKGITFFSIGVLVGIILCLSLYLIDHNYFSKTANKQSIIAENHRSDKIEKKSTQKTKSPTQKQIAQDSVITTDSIIAKIDSISSELEENFNYDYGDFAMEKTPEDEYIDEETIVEDKLEFKKTVKVTVKNTELKDETTIPDNIIAYMEVRLWTSPIKNKISYKREHNVLNIKGLSINNISIYFINGNYYLEDGGHLYTIEENKTYSKLSVIDTAQL